MDTKSLQTFVVVYEEKSISKASEKLFISKQGCSKIIKNLESELDSLLFIRRHYGLEPTKLGDKLYRQANSLMSMLENIINGQDNSPLPEYVLSIGSTLGIQAYLTSKFKKDFESLHPNIRLDILEHPDRTVMQRLADNEIELAILGETLDSITHKAIPFTKNYPCAVINVNHPLSNKKHLAYRDLAHQPIVIENRDFFSHHFVMNRFIKANVKLNIVLETTEIDFLHKQTAQNEEIIGISFDTAALGNVPGNTVIRPFEDRAFIWKTYIVYKKNQHLTPQAERFCEFAVNWYKKHAGKLVHWPEPYNDYNIIYQ